MGAGRPLPKLELTVAENNRLSSGTAAHDGAGAGVASAHRAGLRARGDELASAQTAARDAADGRQVRQRFVEQRLDGLVDARGRGSRARSATEGRRGAGHDA